MVSYKAATRGTSVVPTTDARDLLKRRDKLSQKPFKSLYKTKQEKVITKKQKLKIETSFSKQSPPGYTFLPVGTPPLAELCKELSRTRGLSIYVVNAEPVSNNALNPQKISHHISRIGYHFCSAVVEEACVTLEYAPYKDGFVQISELQQIQQNQQQNSVVANAFAKHGLYCNQVKESKEPKETPIHICAAIRELFPLIPQDDLNQVVTHSWSKGAHRVGSAKDIDLPRRVQLAVTARIRHTYTDYDRLLAAFGDWKFAREQVEPVTLKKLFEWRGEVGEDDETMEEIVREFIVIDDDDDGDDGDDDGGDPVEISHRPARADGLRAEEASERGHRLFQRPVSPRLYAQRNDIARQKIRAFKSQERNARAYAHNQPAVYQYPPHPNAQPTFVPSREVAPRQIFVDGQTLRLVDAPQQRAPPGGPYLHNDRPVESIERDDRVDLPSPVYHSQPNTPKPALLPQRHNHPIDLTQDSPGYVQPQHGLPHHQHDRRHPFPSVPHGTNVVDLTSPPRRPYERGVVGPEIIHVISSGDGRYVQAPVDQQIYTRAPGPLSHVRPAEGPRPQGRYYDPNAVEYDPNRVLLANGHITAPTSRYGSPAQPAWRQHEQIPSEHARHPDQLMVQYTYPVTAPFAATVPQMRSVPVPIHGAPAPVQQMPRDLARPHHTPTSRYDLAAADPQRQPVYAVPQHAQYYPR